MLFETTLPAAVGTLSTYWLTAELPTGATGAELAGVGIAARAILARMDRGLAAISAPLAAPGPPIVPACGGGRVALPQPVTADAAASAPISATSFRR